MWRQERWHIGVPSVQPVTSRDTPVVKELDLLLVAALETIYHGELQGTSVRG